MKPKGKPRGRKGGRPKKYGEPLEQMWLPISIVNLIKFNGIEWLQNLINREQQGN